ncbi:hypothetical protein ACS0TY_001332 [Phlomoides rotata]
MFKNCKKRLGILPNVFTCNILLKALCKKDDVESALKVLDEMPAMGIIPNVVSYTTIMAGYVDRGDMMETKRVLVDLLDRGWLPDATTYMVLMNGFCKLGQIVNATKVMDEMVENGVEPNAVTYSVMIEALCKEKKSGEAVNMVSDMLDRKYVPDSALCCREGIKIFDEMLDKGCSPNEATYFILIEGLCEFGCEADVSNVLSLAASSKVEISSDSWRILVNKFVSDHEKISVALERVLLETAS